jgi:catechol 2,3-dioxygenase-like lactoylglutathione lyase family enzyme
MSDLTLHHVHLVTNDIQGFCDFYGQNFGAEIVFDDLIDGDRNIFLKIGTGRIHLFESRSAAPDGRNSFHHLGMMVENLDAVVDRLRGNGVKVSDITRTPGGGFAMAMAPDHVKIELFEVKSEAARRFFVDADKETA